MITVRFPSGFSIQYNDANIAIRSSEYTDLYDSSAKKKWFAQVPNTCVIERATSCRLYNPVASDSDTVRAEVDALRREVRSLTRKVGKIGGGK